MPFVGSYLWRLRQKIGHSLVLMPGASIVVTNPEGQVLLTKRTDDGLWCTPGGAVEEGSTFLSTALTELEEEIGIKASPEDLVPYACISNDKYNKHVYPSGDVVHYFSLCFAIENNTKPALAADEVEEVRYFDFDKLPTAMMKPAIPTLDLYRKFKTTGQFQAA